MIFFKCVGCGKPLQIGDEWAGKLGNCPLCQTISPVPGPQQYQVDYPRRTSKLTILARLTAWPITVIGFWVSMFCIAGVSSMVVPFVIGGLGAVFGLLFFMWAGTNLIMWILNPREMKLWTKDGGDPFFDTLPEMFNPDPPSTRYQELYRERLRLEEEEGHNFDGD